MDLDFVRTAADPIGAVLALLLMILASLGAFESMDETTIIEISSGLFAILAGTRAAIERRKRMLEGKSAKS